VVARVAVILMAVVVFSLSGCVTDDGASQTADIRKEKVALAVEHLNDFALNRNRLIETAPPPPDTLRAFIDAAEADFDAGYDFDLIEDDVRTIRQAVDETIAEGSDEINGVAADAFAAYADALDEWIAAEEPATRPLIDCIKLATGGMSPDAPMEVVGAQDSYVACVFPVVATTERALDALVRMGELRDEINRTWNG
jgi:hypothetical protein